MPSSNLAEYIIADKDRRLFEEIELFDVQRKAKGLKASQELRGAYDREGEHLFY
jgi:hypothetical protein